MSDLLKQSIADAKAVREAALSNAKTFLEEQFSSSMKEMFADNLNADMTKAPTDESLTSSAIGKGTGHDSLNTSSIGNGKGKLVQVQEGDPEAPANEQIAETEDVTEDVATVADPVAESCDDDDVDVDVDDEEDLDESLSSTELEEILAELSGDLSENEEADAEPDLAAAVAADEAVPTDDEINLDEILAELEGEVRETFDAPAAPAPEVDPVPPIAAPAAAPVAPEPPVGDIPVAPELAPAPPVENPMDEYQVTAEEMAEALVAMNEENNTLKSDLSEHIKTVKYLKGVLSETNLLNAKLLYTNKLFKGKKLNEAQKMKIIETFDLTKSIREVKLAYSVLAESVNFGSSVARKKTNATAQHITEGLASKPVTSTKPSSDLIVETASHALAARFKQLAGITA
jgi:hypothetical protein